MPNTAANQGTSRGRWKHTPHDDGHRTDYTPPNNVDDKERDATMSTDPLLPAPPPEPPRFARDPGAERPDPRVAEKREAQTSGRPSTSDEGGPRPLLRRPVFWIVVAVLLTVNWASLLMIQSDEPRVEVPFSPYFIDQVRAGEVESISSKGDTIEGTFTSERRYPSGDPDATPTARFSTEVPSFWDDTELTGLLQSEGVEINAESPDSRPSLLGQLLLGFGPTLLLVGLFVLLARRSAGTSALGNFGRSKARRVDPETIRITFDDVAGIDEAESELAEIVDFLKTPQRYARLGGRMPHGVLLFGPPGTGKTLLARAVAGQANAAFFSIAASEFIEAIVGVGAARVRDLFAKAKAAAPAIIFIDELDAIGRSRQGSAALTGSNDEREQTLNQILTEMDGFEPTEAVVVLGATNRPEILDPALLRPGRFDRRVAVQPPDRAGRRKILDVHTRSIPLAADADLDTIAASTPGMVGADLANLANEAALLATRRNHDKVQMADLTDSLEKIVLGAPRGIMVGPADRERTAYHEAGHALVGMLTPEADPVRKISIIPRGVALGVTLSTPDTDRVTYSRTQLEAQIKVALGGRVAEEIVYGDVTTGAEADIQRLTQIARQMVGRWGMSQQLGPVSVLPSNDLGLPGTSETSPQTQWIVDQEVRRLIETAHGAVTQLLSLHRAQLDSLTNALLNAETLDAADAYAAADIHTAAAAEADLIPVGT